MSRSPEVDKFSKLAPHWWESTGTMRTLHEINPARMSFILKHASLSGKRIADVGCGAGILSEALAKEHAHVVAIDPSNELIEQAKQHAKEQTLSIDYQAISLEHLLQTHARSFDIVCSLECLEHVEDAETFVRQLTGLLKPGGQLFLSTLNRTPKAYLLGIVLAEHVLKLLPKHTHSYRLFIKPHELAQILREEGTSVLDIQGLQYNPWTHAAHLNQDTSINYLLYAQRNDVA